MIGVVLLLSVLQELCVPKCMLIELNSGSCILMVLAKLAVVCLAAARGARVLGARAVFHFLIPPQPGSPVGCGGPEGAGGFPGNQV